MRAVQYTLKIPLRILIPGRICYTDQQKIQEERAGYTSCDCDASSKALLLVRTIKGKLFFRVLPSLLGQRQPPPTARTLSKNGHRDVTGEQFCGRHHVIHHAAQRSRANPLTLPLLSGLTHHSALGKAAPLSPLQRCSAWRRKDMAVQGADAVLSAVLLPNSVFFAVCIQPCSLETATPASSWLDRVQSVKVW